MPKPLPPYDSTHDAVLATWEAGQGASAPDHTNPAYQALRTAFLQHPDVVALDTAIATAQAEPSVIEVHTLHLLSGLTGLRTHIEQIDAPAAGRAPTDTGALLEQIVLNILENHLHGLAADPPSHPNASSRDAGKIFPRTAELVAPIAVIARRTQEPGTQEDRRGR
ncbi:hypothetical protein [Gemmobacter sp.]|uniref:hypothetical protein n=1 Tax=Gemmobacter sp. TaxID=1898957 RepID=UPI002AFEE698|nr:hypothetical protein [Gemmobacter sp.]